MTQRVCLRLSCGVPTGQLCCEARRRLLDTCLQAELMRIPRSLSLAPSLLYLLLRYPCQERDP